MDMKGRHSRLRFPKEEAWACDGQERCQDPPLEEVYSKLKLFFVEQRLVVNLLSQTLAFP